MSTRAYASALIPLPANDVWKALRQFDFPSTLISTVEKVELSGGDATSVGALRTVTWKSGETQSHRLLTLDDQYRLARWELVASEPQAEVSATISELRVFRVTETNESVVAWSSDFSSDATGDFVVFTQKAQLENIKEIRAALTGAAASSE
jgi:Polyketide cyclase / dehydrase and lipid transport